MEGGPQPKGRMVQIPKLMKKQRDRPGDVSSIGQSLPLRPPLPLPTVQHTCPRRSKTNGEKKKKNVDHVTKRTPLLSQSFCQKLCANSAKKEGSAGSDNKTRPECRHWWSGGICDISEEQFLQSPEPSSDPPCQVWRVLRPSDKAGRSIQSTMTNVDCIYDVHMFCRCQLPALLFTLVRN